MKLCPVCERKFEDKSAFCPFDGEVLANDNTGDDLVGRLVDHKYQIEARIARGGTGTVYRALHLQLNVPVAIKILHHDRSNDATAVERFRREAYAAMQVRHPNAIGIFDFGVTADNLVYVVMELLVGLSLRQRLKQQCYYSIIEVNNIMQQICAAVAVAHKHKIVHRDLKPENVFIHSDGGEEVVRVLDFGLAKLRGLNEEGEESFAITRDGLVIGTPLYMSPEQSRGRQVDKRSDIYSLGVMLYELLTGQLPFRGASLSALAIKHATEQPRPIYQVRPGLPGVLNAVVMHALEKLPQKRPASVSEWAAELQAAIKVVTEKEFRNIFLTASDEDLEAALLLTGDSPQLDLSLKLSSRLTGGLTGALAEKLGKEFFELHSPTSQLTGTINDPLARVSATDMSSSFDQIEQDSSANSFKDSLSRDSNTMSDGDGLDDISSEEINEQMLGLAQETSVLLQIIIGDLSAQMPLDGIFFDELDVAMEKLRDKMKLARAAKRI